MNLCWGDLNASALHVFWTILDSPSDQVTCPDFGDHQVILLQIKGLLTEHTLHRNVAVLVENKLRVVSLAELPSRLTKLAVVLLEEHFVFLNWRALVVWLNPADPHVKVVNCSRHSLGGQGNCGRIERNLLTEATPSVLVFGPESKEVQLTWDEAVLSA